jgi:nicotinate phosphoribosyltransferase
MVDYSISDEYFNRSAAIVENDPAYNKKVRYCVFARKPGIVCGIDRALEWIGERARGPLTIRARYDGDDFAALEAVMVLEGLFEELVTWETVYLGMLSLSGGTTRMAEIVSAAGDAAVVDMSPRHYPPEVIEAIAYAAAVGGAQGTSTRKGYRYVQSRLRTGRDDRIQVRNRPPVEFKVYGSIPHALNAVYNGSSIASARAYHEQFPDIPLTVLIDFEGRELDVAREAVEVFRDALFAVRIDTHGARVHQGGHEKPVAELMEHIMGNTSDPEAARQALDHYGFGKGVTIESAYNVRRALDEAGGRGVKILVSSGFTPEKTRAFSVCRAPMDAVGTGSWVQFLMFTSDITHVWEQGRWIPRSKARRGEEIILPELDIRLQKG